MRKIITVRQNLIRKIIIISVKALVFLIAVVILLVFFGGKSLI